MTRHARIEEEMKYTQLILNLSALWRWVVNVTPWPLDTRERSTVSILQDAGRAPGSFWTSVVKRKSLTPTGFEPRIVQPVASHYA